MVAIRTYKINTNEEQRKKYKTKRQQILVMEDWKFVDTYPQASVAVQQRTLIAPSENIDSVNFLSPLSIPA